VVIEEINDSPTCRLQLAVQRAVHASVAPTSDIGLDILLNPVVYFRVKGFDREGFCPMGGFVLHSC